MTCWFSKRTYVERYIESEEIHWSKRNCILTQKSVRTVAESIRLVNYDWEDLDQALKKLQARGWIKPSDPKSRREKPKRWWKGMRYIVWRDKIKERMQKAGIWLELSRELIDDGGKEP